MRKPRLLVVPNDWASDRELHDIRGLANGYILLPPEHPWYKLGYDEIPSDVCDVHGGLTYAREMTIFEESWWALGFDTAHAGDSPERWSLDAVWKETLRLWEQEQEFFRRVEQLLPQPNTHTQ